MFVATSLNANVLIAGAYALAPLIFLAYFARVPISARPLGILISAFLGSSGVGYFLEALDLYRDFPLWQWGTAIFAWMIVGALFVQFPRLLQHYELMDNVLRYVPAGIGVFEQVQLPDRQDLRWLLRSERAISDVGADPLGTILGDEHPGHRDRLLGEYLEVLQTGKPIIDRDVEYVEPTTGKRGVYHQNCLRLPDNHLLICWVNVTQLRVAEEKLFYDHLTHAKSLLYFNDLVAKQRHYSALLYIDLDQFKSVNDTLGHAAGDELLRLLTRRFQEYLCEGDELIRIGGDEFLVLLKEPLSQSGYIERGQYFLKAAQRPFNLGDSNTPVVINASVGIVDSRAGNLEAMRLAGDRVMYIAKKNPTGPRLAVWNREAASV